MKDLLNKKQALLMDELEKTINKLNITNKKEKKNEKGLIKDPLKIINELITSNRKEKRYNSFYFSQKNIFCAIDFEVTNSKTNPQIYAIGMCMTRNNLAKCFDLEKLSKRKDVYIKTNYHIKNNEYKTKSKIYFDQHADYLCTTNFELFIKILLSSRQHIKIVTQNGSGYDMKFLMYLLPRYGGLVYQEKMGDFLVEDLNQGVEQPNLLEHFLFSYLLDKNKKVFYLELITQNNKKLMFFDDYLINKTTLKEKGKLLGWEKLENENNYSRSTLYNSLEEFQKDGNEFAYLKRDCEITLFSFKKFFNFFVRKEGGAYFGITAPSIAFKTWKKYFAKSQIDKLIKNGVLSEEKEGKAGIYYEIKDIKTLNNLINRKSMKKTISLFYLIKAFYKKYFSDDWLTDNVDTFLDLKKRYLGGYTLLNSDPKLWIKPVSDKEKLFSLDINSMYPSIMNSDLPCPYGPDLKNIKTINEKYYQCFDFKAKIDMTTDLTPIFHQDTNGLRSWIKKIKKDQVLEVTSDMLENIEKRYGLKNFKITIKHSFATKPFKFFFGDFIEEFYKQKKEAKNETEKQGAKLLLNSCYGKFGSNLQVEKSYYDTKNNMFIQEDDMQTGYYIPVGIAITSTSRSLLQKQLENNTDKIVYEDTDSLKIVATLEESVSLLSKLDIDNKKLGSFKFEWWADTWLFKRTKNYFAWNYTLKKCYFANNGVNWRKEWEYYNETNKINKAKWETKDEQENTAYWYFGGVVSFEQLFSSYELKNQQDSKNLLGVGVSIRNVTKTTTPVWEYPSYKEQKIKNKKLKDLVYNIHKEHINDLKKSIINSNTLITEQEMSDIVEKAKELYKINEKKLK